MNSLSKIICCHIFVFLFSGILLKAQGQHIRVDDSDEDVTILTVSLEFCPHGVETEDIENFIGIHQDRVEEIWNSNTRRFRIAPGAPRKEIRIRFEYSIVDDCDAPRDPKKYRIRLHPGMPPRSEGRNAYAANLFLGNTPRTVSHEIGHAMGLHDEYNRQNPNITNQNLMGSSSSSGSSGSSGSMTVTNSHIVTLLFLHHSNPNAELAGKRNEIKSMLSTFGDRNEARRRSIENGVNAKLFDSQMAILDANRVPIQPPPPPLPPSPSE